MRSFACSSGSPASARRPVTKASSRDLASRTASPSAISAETDSARPSSTSRDAHSYSSSFREIPIFLVTPQSYRVVVLRSHRMARRRGSGTRPALRSAMFRLVVTVQMTPSVLVPLPRHRSPGPPTDRIRRCRDTSDRFLLDTTARRRGRNHRRASSRPERAETPPPQATALRRGRNPQTPQHPPHRRHPNRVPQAEQLALEPLVAPGRVLPRHPLDQHREPGVDRRPSCPGRIGPVPADQPPMPPQQRLRRYEPTHPRRHGQQPSPPCAGIFSGGLRHRRQPSGRRQPTRWKGNRPMRRLSRGCRRRP